MRSYRSAQISIPAYTYHPVHNRSSAELDQRSFIEHGRRSPARSSASRIALSDVPTAEEQLSEDAKEKRPVRSSIRVHSSIDSGEAEGGNKPGPSETRTERGQTLDSDTDQPLMKRPWTDQDERAPSIPQNSSQ
jgi:hypothetical protein